MLRLIPKTILVRITDCTAAITTATTSTTTTSRKINNVAATSVQVDSSLASSSSSSSSSSACQKGEYYYNRAKHFVEQHKLSLELKQEEKQRQQYEKKKSGIAVIKTIARQTRQERDQQQTQQVMTDGTIAVTNRIGTTDHHDGSHIKLDNLEKAREYMQLSAFVHGYNDAIVSLANDALSKPQINVDNEYKYALKQQDSVLFDMNEIRKSGKKSGAHVAMKLYQWAGQRGSKEAWFNLGHLLWTGHDLNETCTILPNPQEAIETFEKAVDLGDDDARYFLAVHYLGQESETVKRRGLALVQEAADHGHGGALYYLALLYRNGEEELGIDPCLSLFRQYLDEAADHGDPDALFLRAHCMFHGEDGYDINKLQSLEGFLDAGKAGNADGFVSAGAIYHHGGINVKQDQRKAFELYQQAGEMGSAEGWKNVIACYLLGEGVPKCEKTAQYIQKTILNCVIKDDDTTKDKR